MNAPSFSDSRQFFVRGVSRSGGTLMATILDAHPDISMSYETYEHLLAGLAGQNGPKVWKMRMPRRKSAATLLGVKRQGLSQSDPDLAKFFARARRAGIYEDKLFQLLEDHFARGLGFDNFKDRMLFVESLSREKMRTEGKQHWGAKILSVYDELEEIYVCPHYVFMLRDGRDIVASRKNVGKFDQTVEHVAKSWRQQVEKFEDLIVRLNGRAVFVHYETLASEPESALRTLMNQLGLRLDNNLLSSHSMDLTIHRNSMGHLSGTQVRAPLSQNSIGRWKSDLTPEEVSRFEAVAGGTLEKFGYL